MSRRLLAIALCLGFAASLSGCWVIDEIDKGKKLMDDHSPKAKKEEKAAAPAKVAAQNGALDNYFNQEAQKGTTKTFSPGQMSEGIVACKVGGATEFTTKENCAAKGGHP